MYGVHFAFVLSDSKGITHVIRIISNKVGVLVFTGTSRSSRDGSSGDMIVRHGDCTDAQQWRYRQWMEVQTPDAYREKLRKAEKS